MAGSLVAGVYEKAVDRESAFELLKAKAEASAKQAEEAKVQAEQEKAEKAEEKGNGRMGFMEAFGKSAVRAAGSAIGRQVIRGVLGGLFGGGKKKGGLFG